MNVDDTIVAISSAAGLARRMIVRVSGPATFDLLASLTAEPINHAAARWCDIAFAGLAVPAWVYAFHRPRSYTGDDLAELHLPGNPLLARMLVDHLLAAGARSAEPGEFTARAFFNGRLDLTAAEGVAATIAARSEGDLRAARQLLAGELARRVRPIVDAIAELLALVEVGIDFVDEDVTFLPREELGDRLAALAEPLRRLLEDAGRIEAPAPLPTVVLAGLPNAGKSTLLNALAGTERAVVSPIAGTTRDTLSAEIAVPGGMIQLIDIAGLETAASSNEIALHMYAAARRAIELADVVVHVIDGSSPNKYAAALPRVDLVVLTKADLPMASSAVAAITVSAHSGHGLDDLRRRLSQLAFRHGGSPARLTLNGRHTAALTASAEAVAEAIAEVADGNRAEVVAAALRDALDAAGSILGGVSPDDVLGQIFSRFCIGK